MKSTIIISLMLIFLSGCTTTKHKELYPDVDYTVNPEIQKLGLTKEDIKSDCIKQIVLNDTLTFEQKRELIKFHNLYKGE